MVDATRAMLDELMGKERDKPLAERSDKPLRFYDKDICKYDLCGLCPSSLFTNTKSYLGPCKYEMHEDQLGFEEIKAEWDALPDRDKLRYGYEQELLTVLEGLVKDMDRKIERQKERATKESAPRPLSAEDRARLDDILARQKTLVEQSEKVAEEGEVDASMAMAAQAEKLKAEHDKLHASLTAPERIMSVCEVCGVFINSTDNEQRRQDHLEGKQYLGWLAIREKHQELRKKLAAAPRVDRERDYRDRDRSRHETSSRRSSRDGDRERDRPRERERSRERDRDERRRGHSSERRRRERDRGHEDDRRRRR